MEKEQIDKVLSKIEKINLENSELNSLLAKLPITTREEILEDISKKIIKNNTLFKELEITQEILDKSDTIEPHSMQAVLDNLISNIKKNPSRKIIYLRIFLERFHDISEQDKNVILQSIKDEDYKDLKEKLLSLINVFKLKI